MVGLSWRYALLIGTLLLLTACAAAIGPPATSAAGAAQHDPARITGRLSLQLDQVVDGQAIVQHFSSAFELRGNPNEGELDLLTPLGSIALQLRWTRSQAQLIRGQRIEPYASAQELIRQTTGIDITPEHLFYWLGADHYAAPAAQEGNWQVDLSARAQGRISVQRHIPSRAVLRIVLDSP